MNKTALSFTPASRIRNLRLPICSKADCDAAGIRVAVVFLKKYGAIVTFNNSSG
jgi:hypothetical protein